GERRDGGADDHARDVLPERHGLGQHAQRMLLQLALVVLEEDEDRHQTSFFSVRNSRIACAALPSSSIRRESPRGGGSESPSTSVPEPAWPASPSRPRSASERTSCGFFFAPMIP